jgi:hypothetical protein
LEQCNEPLSRFNASLERYDEPLSRFNAPSNESLHPQQGRTKWKSLMVMRWRK